MAYERRQRPPREYAPRSGSPDRGRRHGKSRGTVRVDWLDPEYKHYWIDEVPMQRYAQPSEIAPAALYLALASPASCFVTGSVLVIDGGYTLW